MYSRREFTREDIFRWLVAMVNSPSLVTGDHSLSQMIQKSNSKLSVPFFYEMAHWKRILSKNFYLLMRKENE